MTVKCFLGFHTWVGWSYSMSIGDHNRVKDFRTCKHCNTTDMLIAFKFVRTTCLVKYSCTSPFSVDYLGNSTLEGWYQEYRKLEKGMRRIV